MKLTNLADVLRTVVPVVEELGRNKAGKVVSWKEMGRPVDYQHVTNIMNHHTASKTTPGNDVLFCNFNSDIRPLANIILDRTGLAHVCAAGPTNTNGLGRSTWDDTPDNRMNEVAIGIEVCNLGTGEPYPEIQVRNLLRINAALVQHYSIPDLGRAHHEWAPDRKIDPSGPTPGYPFGPGKWNMHEFRNHVFYTWYNLYMSPINTPLPKVEVKNMSAFRLYDSRSGGKVKGTKKFNLDSRVPNTAKSIFLTVTAVGPDGEGFLTVWNGVGGVPTISNLNYKPNTAPICNTTLTEVANRAFSVYAHTATHLIIDVVGYS